MTGPSRLATEPPIPQRRPEPAAIDPTVAQVLKDAGLEGVLEPVVPGAGRGDAFAKGGAPAPVVLKAPALPPEGIKPPKKYEPAPSMEEVVSGAAKLEYGSKGPAVSMIQQALNKMGATPPLKLDGHFGPKTLAALKQFQDKGDVGVTADKDPASDALRNVGIATLEAMGERLSTDDIHKMRDRAIAMWSIQEGSVRSVQKKAAREVTDEDIDTALKDDEWTPKSAADVGKFKVMSQSDWGQQLGTGDKTIRQSGCTLTAYTIAASGLTGSTLNPAQANAKIKAAGGFAGSEMNGAAAAKALGLKLEQRITSGGTNPQGMRTSIDKALAGGKAIVLGVDYKDGSNGSGFGTGVDHWITVTSKNEDGSYTAIDPAGGRKMTLKADANGQLVGAGWAAGTRYRSKEAVILSG